MKTSKVVIISIASVVAATWAAHKANLDIPGLRA